jgi:kynurenine formamidase
VVKSHLEPLTKELPEDNLRCRLTSRTENLNLRVRMSTMALVKFLGAMIALFSLLSCTSPPVPVAEIKVPRAILDLSPTITRDMPTRYIGEKALTMFGDPLSTAFEVTVTEEPFYLSTSQYTILNHIGPHHDAPNHVIKGAMATDAAPLEKFYGKARLLDFRSRPAGEPLLRADFEGAGIQPGEIIIAFVGYEAPTDPEVLPTYSYLSAEAAEYLTEIPVKAFASDMPSLGSIAGYFALIEDGKTGSQAIFPEHYAFASRDIPSIEGLVNLESLVGEEEIVFVGFPLKFEDGDGGPMRAAALVY